VLGALASEIVSLIQGPASDAELAAQDAGRLGAGGQDPNYLAAGLVPGIAIGLGLIRFTAKGPLRMALIATVVALVVGVVATGSRGGFLALLLAVVVGIIISRGRRLQLAVVVAIVIAVGSFWFSTGSLERVKSFDSGTGRVDLWRVATEMSADHPVIGVGINNFQAKSLDYALQPGRIVGIGLVAEQPDVAHNTYLQQLAETGIIGLALLIGALIASMRASWIAIGRFEAVGEGRWADLARSVLVAQVAILTASIFLSNGDDRRMWLLLSFGIVLTSVATRMRGPEAAT
jgi:O-antigen ligase